MAILAFMLLGMVSINMRRTVLDSYMTMNTNRSDQTAILIGRSLIEEIGAKKFDEANVLNRVVRMNNLSTTLGPESGETYATFDDVDDYNNAVFLSPDRGTSGTTGVLAVLDGTEGYSVSVTVSYVNFDDPTQIAMSPTWSKLITVRISDENTSDAVTATLIKTY
jgi:hypothetical protein